MSRPGPVRLAITGASGLLGANVAAAACAAGYEVIGLRRATSRVGHLADLPLRWREASLGDPDSLRRAFEGVDAVIHSAAAVGVRRRPTPGMVAANVDGTRHVIEAARGAAVRRMVHISSTVAVGASDDGLPVTEEHPWNLERHGLADGYAITKRQAEAVALDAARAGFPVTIVNPGFMFGPRDSRPSSGQLIVELLSGKVPAWTPGVNSFVDVRDVSRGILAALERGEVGRRYILGGHNLSYQQVFHRIATVAGVRAPARQAPAGLARIAGRLGNLWEAISDREPLLNSPKVNYSLSPAFCHSSQRARAELGYTIAPLEPAIALAIHEFAERGWVPRRCARAAERYLPG